MGEPMSEVFIVAVSDAESMSVIAVCSTKEIAERELFKKRDELVKQWQESIDVAEEGLREHIVEMYGDMIKNLSGNAYEDWNNYPHDRPYIYEQKVITE